MVAFDEYEIISIIIISVTSVLESKKVWRITILKQMKKINEFKNKNLFDHTFHQNSTQKESSSSNPVFSI